MRVVKGGRGWCEGGEGGEGGEIRSVGEWSKREEGIRGSGREGGSRRESESVATDAPRLVALAMEAVWQAALG